MNRYLLAALLLASSLFTGTAHASTGVLSFVNPTQLTDDSAFPAAQIAGYDVGCKFQPVGGVKGNCATYAPASTSAGSATSITVTLTISAAGGDACFTLVLRSTLNGNSDPSNEACKTFAAVRPKPVSGLQVVQVVLEVPHWAVAFNLNAQGQSTGIVAGFVKVATPCVGEKLFTYRGRDYYRFVLAHPTKGTSNVAWWVTTPNANVAAPCA